MKELAGLIRILRIFGWLCIIVGTMALLALIITPAVGAESILIGGILIFFGGILYLVIASGLSKKKKWAWYLGVVVFICNAISGFLSMTLGSIVGGIIAIGFLIVLLKERKAIFEEPESPAGAS